MAPSADQGHIDQKEIPPPPQTWGTIPGLYKSLKLSKMEGDFCTFGVREKKGHAVEGKDGRRRFQWEEKVEKTVRFQKRKQVPVSFSWVPVCIF